MVNTYTITSTERKVIRSLARSECARNLSRLARIEIGVRYNVDNPDMDTTHNIFLLTDNEHWDDTDLWSTTDWGIMYQKLPMTDDGRAIIDFYLYDRNELICNLQAEFDSKGLLAIHADLEKNRWRRDES